MNPLYEWYEHFNYVWKKKALGRPCSFITFYKFSFSIKKNHKNEDSFKM